MDWINSIEVYKPYNEQEESDKRLILSYIRKFDDILMRENEMVHMTSSSFILNKTRDKVLMVYHNIYNSWAWTGGHADGEDDLLSVAIKEAKEETGVKKIYPIMSEIFGLDILPVQGHVKNGKYISAHLHISINYLLEADENEALAIKEDENSDVRWIPIDQVVKYSSEPHMQKVYSKLIVKIKETL